MDISLNGTLYVYFIRSVFEGNKKIGIVLLNQKLILRLYLQTHKQGR